MMANCSNLNRGVVSSPIGNWDFEYCPRGLHFVKLAKEVTNDNFVQKGSATVEAVGAVTGDGDAVSGNFHRWMRLYFDSDKENTGDDDCKVCPSVFGDGQGKQSFRQRVWETLYRRVDFGRTVSYGELARLSGSAGASRAVGSAMANNPVSLVVPCHRVISAGGAAGHYAGKTKDDVKVWLLRHEGAMS